MTLQELIENAMGMAMSDAQKEQRRITRKRIAAMVSGRNRESERRPVVIEQKYHTPVIPGELWGLWNEQNGGWVPTMDCSGGETDPIMVLLNRDDAEIAARRQNEMHELSCVPVRLK